MTFRSIVRTYSQSFTIVVLLCVGLYLASLYSYVLFHVIAEGFSIVIAVSLFLIAWNTRNLSTNTYVLFLGIAFFFTGIIDFFHTLTYKGMDIFIGYDANLPTQLWIAARYLQSLSLLAAPWFIDRKLNIRAVLVFYLFATTLLLSAVFSGTLFPDCFIEGKGLTPFKIVSEYIISFILISSLALLVHHRDTFEPHILWLIAGSILCTIVSEMAFTFYISVYGLSNLIGHYLKILAFYLIYRAIIVTGLKNPYSLLFYDLQKNREELQMIIDSSPIMIFYKDLENRFIRVNEAFAEATGLTREEIEGRRSSEIYPDQGGGYWEDNSEIITSGTSKTDIIEPIDSAGGIRWLRTDKIPYRDMEGNIVGIIGFSIDITERKQAEEKLLESEKKYREMYDFLPIPVFEMDFEANLTSVNRAVYETFRGTEEDLERGVNAWKFSSPEDIAKSRKNIERLLKGEQPEGTEYTLPRLDGSTFPAIVISSLIHRDGKPVGIRGAVVDITERKQAEEQIRQMAYHDSLTGLPNRKLFSDRLGIALTQAQRNKKEVGIAMLDLDNFKEVNDTLGHTTGDLLLKAAAERLTAELRKGDTVARIGGDEFMLILPGLKGTEDAIRVARKIIDGFRKPFRIDTHQLVVTTSLGIAMYPHDGTGEEILLKNADIAMYQAKHGGRNRYRFYQET